MSADPGAAARVVAPAADSTLAHLPVGLFGATTGIGGLGAAWRLAHDGMGLPLWPSEVLAAASLLAFAAMFVAYAAKVATAPGAVRAEFEHPVSGNLFGLVPIALMLLPIPLAPHAPRLATALWATGAVTCIAFIAASLSRWMSTRQSVESALPAWIIPVAAPLNLLIAMPALGLLDQQDLALFAFSGGLFFSVLVFVLVISRLVFQAPPSQEALPALLILTAPFSVGVSGYPVVGGRIDVFASGLFMVDLLLLCVLLPLLRHLPRCCPFRVSWWAVSFPLAAATVAAMHIAAAAPGPLHAGVAMALLAVTTLVTLWLVARTTLGLMRGEVRQLVGM